MIASADIKKQAKNLDDCHASITVCRTGTPKGDQGPTTFLMKGKKKRNVYTEKFLMRHGTTPGSEVIVIENAFVTTLGEDHSNIDARLQKNKQIC